MFCVYFLQSTRSKKFYIGSTNDISRRLIEHNSGKVTATAQKGPWDIVFVHECESLTEARKLEVRIKKLKSRKIIEKIAENQELSVRALR